MLDCPPARLQTVIPLAPTLRLLGLWQAPLRELFERYDLHLRNGAYVWNFLNPATLGHNLTEGLRLESKARSRVYTMGKTLV